MVIPVTEYPSFANRTLLRRRSGEQLGQTPATPKSILIDGFESKWIERYLIHNASGGRRSPRDKPFLPSIANRPLSSATSVLAASTSSRALTWGCPTSSPEFPA